METKKKKVCMIVQNPMVKGGIASVVNGYRGSKLEKDYDIIYVESYKDGGKVAKLFKALSGYIHFIKVLILDNPDLIHIHSSFGPSFYRKIPFIYLASWAKKPIINHIHGSEFDELYTNASEKKQKLVKKVWDKCDRFIVLSEEWKHRFSVVIPKEKMSVIENYSLVKENYDFHECNNQILFLGAINKMKGCFDMPEIISLVAEKVPDVKMIVAGFGEIEEVKRLASEKGVLDKFVFPGWVKGKEKENLLENSDVFFLPSYTEGMPMSILDSMGFGLPIVSTNVGGIPKIVREGTNGYLVKPGDKDSFAAKLTELLLNDNKRNLFGKNSYEIAKNDYSLNSHINAVEKVYRSVNAK